MAQYTRNAPLLESAVARDPLLQLEAWLDDAREVGMIEPVAMTLATVDAAGRPSARVVLFRGLHDGGLTFYTNYRSRKGQDIEARPDVALTFWWDALERQVRIEGRASLLPRSMAEAYFAQRPRESQIGAAVSQQSAVIESREELHARFDHYANSHEGQTITCPPHWGGYCVQPRLIEFWQGALGRYHDRLCYRREGDGWTLQRLQP